MPAKAGIQLQQSNWIPACAGMTDYGRKPTHFLATDMVQTMLARYALGSSVRSHDRLQIYGAGIVSSYGESRFALDDRSPNRIAFDLKRLMRTRYRIDDYQQSYFVIDSFEDLLRQTIETDFAPLYQVLDAIEDLNPPAVLSGDRLYHRGSQSRAYRPA